MNFFLIAALSFALSSSVQGNELTAREVFDKCKARVLEIDKNLGEKDIQFTQRIEIKSRGGDQDELVFMITVKHGKFERKLVSSTVENGGRFDSGYDAFDRMFFLSEYFNDNGKSLTSCEFEKTDCGSCYGINFTLSKLSNPADQLNVVSASLTSNDFTPLKISERLSGLPLGIEFDNDVSVSYDKNLDLCYPASITMRIYAHLFFIKGEVAIVTIDNKDLKAT